MRQNHRDIGEKEILDTLLNDSYSNDFNAIFSQYHLLVETTNEIGTRRENMNKFYLSLITILYGIITHFYLLIVIFYFQLYQFCL